MVSRTLSLVLLFVVGVHKSALQPINKESEEATSPSVHEVDALPVLVLRPAVELLLPPCNHENFLKHPCINLPRSKLLVRRGRNLEDEVQTECTGENCSNGRIHRTPSTRTSQNFYSGWKK